MNKSEATRHYRQLHSKLSALLTEFDPCALRAGGAPQDEYEREATLLLARLSRATTPQDVIAAATDVLAEAFGDDALPAQSVAELGRRIYEWWTRAANR